MAKLSAETSKGRSFAAWDQRIVIQRTHPSNRSHINANVNMIGKKDSAAINPYLVADRQRFEALGSLSQAIKNSTIATGPVKNRSQPATTRNFSTSSIRSLN